MANITIRIHHDFSEIDPSEWDHLLEKSATNVPFLRYGYLEQWWQHRGGGEWPEQAQPSIYSVWDADRLIGIAPLFAIRNSLGRQDLHMLGSVEISDYLDFIAEPEDLPAFLNALLEVILQDDSVDTLILVNIPESAPSLKVLDELTSNSAWQMKVEKVDHTPSIRLADDWDTYLAGIDKKQRHEIRRKLRRVESSPIPVRWYIIKDEQHLQDGIENFLHLMQMDENKKSFLTQPMRDQMTAILKWAFSSGYLQLSFLEIDGYKSASYCCFDYNNHILVYNSGFDMNFSSYSPGWVLLSYLIQHAIAEKKTCFDFMQGNEEYKYRFGASDSYVMRAQIERRS